MDIKARVDGIKQEIANELTARGYQWDLNYKLTQIDQPDAKLYLPWIEFVEERTNGGRYSVFRRENGKLQILVGDPGDRSRYRQRKDGSFRISDLVDDVLARVQRKQLEIDANRTARARAEENAQYRADLCKNYGISQYGGCLSIDKDTGGLTFTANNLTRQQAEALIVAACEAGVKL